MGGVGGQSPTEGEGLLIGTAKGQGTKDRGGGSARMRKPKFKIHGHQTERQQARIMAGALRPSPMSVSLLPGQQAGRIPGRVNKDDLVCSFAKNIFIMDNFKQVQRIV